MRFLQRESHDKILNQLLGVPYEFVLSQHFKPFSKGDALSMLAGWQRDMKVFVFGAHVLEEELEEVLGDLQANKIALLEHALCVMVLAGAKRAADCPPPGLDGGAGGAHHFCCPARGPAEDEATLVVQKRIPAGFLPVI